MIKIRCIICNEDIIKPRVGQLCCDRQDCRRLFNSNMTDLWKLENPDKVKEMNKKSYFIRKHVESKDL